MVNKARHIMYGSRDQVMERADQLSARGYARSNSRQIGPKQYYEEPELTLTSKGRDWHSLSWEEETGDGSTRH